MASKLRYYFSSLITLALNVKNWGAIIKLVIGSNENELIIKFRNGLQFHARSLMDVWIIKETCLDEDYEFEPFKGGTIIDIGAGLGDYSIFKAFSDPTAIVYAIEPFADSYQLLEKNIELNNIENIQQIPIAIGGESGELVLADTGEAVQHTTTGSNLVGGGEKQMRVNAVSLDDFFERESIDRCQFLKIDCEGSEFDILMNTSAATFKKIERIGLEYHNGYTEFNHLDLLKLLEDNGFQATSKQNPVHAYLGFIFAKQN